MHRHERLSFQHQRILSPHREGLPTTSAKGRQCSPQIKSCYQRRRDKVVPKPKVSASAPRSRIANIRPAPTRSLVNRNKIWVIALDYSMTIAAILLLLHFRNEAAEHPQKRTRRHCSRSSVGSSRSVMCTSAVGIAASAVACKAIEKRICVYGFKRV